jgi:GxxExxY protein
MGALKVHSALGPGLLESAYEACLAHELKQMGFEVQTQVALPIVYDGVTLELGYRIDMLVNDLVIVELKSVEEISRVHVAQAISYLKLSKKSSVSLSISMFCTSRTALSDWWKGQDGNDFLCGPSCPLWLSSWFPQWLKEKILWQR